MQITLAAMIVLTLAGCTWVDLTEDGARVTLVTAVPDSCRRLGTTTSFTRAEIARIDRNDSKVSGELVTLARNAAARMGGDTITAESEISDTGEQTFVVYRCGADA